MEDFPDLHLECVQDVQVQVALGYKVAHGMRDAKTSRVVPKVWHFFRLKPALCLLVVPALGDNGLYWQGAICARSGEENWIEQPGKLWMQHSS